MQLKAYARLTSRPNRLALLFADPENKVYTFKFNHTTNYGPIVFTIIYIANTLLSMVLTILLLPSIFAAYDMVVNRGTFLDNSSQVQLMVIALLASLFMIAIYISEIIQLSDTHGSNPLILLKVISSILFLTSCVTVTNIHYVCCQPRNCLNILKMCGVTLLSAFVFTLIHDIFPTILIFFAFPVDTFTLLALHIALFYTETMVGALVVCQSRKFWKHWGTNLLNKKTSHHTDLVQATEETELGDRAMNSKECLLQRAMKIHVFFSDQKYLLYFSIIPVLACSFLVLEWSSFAWSCLYFICAWCAFSSFSF